MDLFDDIPDDLDQIPIDDLFFSDYMDTLLEPSSSSEAFSGSRSEQRQELDGLSPSFSATNSSSRNRSHSLEPQATADTHMGNQPRQGSSTPPSTSPFLETSQGQGGWPYEPQASGGMGGASQALPPVISLEGLPSRGSLGIALPALDSMDLALPHFDLQPPPAGLQPQLTQQLLGDNNMAWNTFMDPSMGPVPYSGPGSLPNWNQGAGLPMGVPGLQQMPAMEPAGYFGAGGEAAQPMGQSGPFFSAFQQTQMDPQGMSIKEERTGSFGMGGNNLAEMRTGSEGSAGQANSGNSGFPAMPDGGGMQFSSGMGGGTEGEGEAPKKGARRNRNRTEHQQNLNKLAQQRYRERKKQKALETERAAAQLAARIEEFNLIKERYRQLSDDNEALQASLNKADSELAKLQKEKPAEPVSSRQEAGSEPGRAAEIVSELDGKAQQLRAALGGTGVDHPETALREPDKVPKEVLAALEALVEGVNTLFLQLQRLEGVNVWHSYAEFSKGKACPDNCTCYFCQQKAAGKDFAAGLCLSAEQIGRLQYVRDKYVKKLQDLYTERQQLNMAAVRVMLPQGFSGPPGDAGGYGFMGFFQRAKQSANVTEVLDKLKENLRLEQRASAEVDFTTFKRILNPVQGAHFVLQSFPAKADTVGLGRAVKGQS